MSTFAALSVRTDSSPLTTQQARVLQLIRSAKICPTVRELAASLSVTPNAITGHLKALERKGRIRRTGLTRAIEVLEIRAAILPYLGEVG